MPSRLLETRWALTPPFHPCQTRRLWKTARRFCLPAVAETPHRRYILCGTVRRRSAQARSAHPTAAARRPGVTRRVALTVPSLAAQNCGVRTFLPAGLLRSQPSDHPACPPLPSMPRSSGFCGRRFNGGHASANFSFALVQQPCADPPQQERRHNRAVLQRFSAIGFHQPVVMDHSARWRSNKSARCSIVQRLPPSRRIHPAVEVSASGIIRTKPVKSHRDVAPLHHIRPNAVKIEDLVRRQIRH